MKKLLVALMMMASGLAHGESIEGRTGIKTVGSLTMVLMPETKYPCDPDQNLAFLIDLKRESGRFLGCWRHHGDWVEMVYANETIELLKVNSFQWRE